MVSFNSLLQGKKILSNIFLTWLLLFIQNSKFRAKKKKKKKERERENPMTVSVFERLILVNKWIAIYQPEAEFSRGTSGMFFQVFLDKLDSIAHNHTYS